MSRRKHSGEVNIGSDSFLDVIANIVGILIILIVIAGVRVSRAPVLKVAPPVADSVPEEPAPIPDAYTIPDSVPVATFAPEPAEPTEPLEPMFIESTDQPAELTAKMQSIHEQIDALEAEAAANIAAKRELEERQARGELEVTTGRNTLLKGQAVRDSHIRGLAEIQALIDAQKKSLQTLMAQLDEQKKALPKTNTLKHRVTPISRIVQGEQLHYRLNGNKVSYVPLRDLLESAMRRAKSHGDDLAQHRMHLGTAGPIGGYRLQYKLEVVAASAAETARFGPGMVRIALTSFQLEPELDLREESAEEALTSGSTFDIAMQTAEPGSTFTLWVYPDSFSLYRQLQAKLHASGFTVAARPLPNGIPIAGSPDGSASAGQ